MAKLRSKHARCSVIGCINEQRSLFLLPSCDYLKTQWVDFIFNERVKRIPNRILYVCSQHFTEECFHNLGAYKEGFAVRLLLQRGSVPTIRDSGKAETASTFSLCDYLPTWRDVTCQTDPLDTCTVGTQLTCRTAQPQFTSAGVQATVSCKDSCVGTSTADDLCSSTTPVERPLKRSRLGGDDESEQQDDPVQGSSLIAASERLDSVHEPAESVTTSTELTASEESSAPANKDNRYVVCESSIMELFAVCPVCTRACDARPRSLGTLLSVEQWCPHCEFYRQWTSQPAPANTPDD